MTIVIIGLTIGAAMSILDRLVGAMIDMRLQAAAFETARENMEALLSRDSIKDRVDYGVSEVNPDIHWQVVVEPFHEPVNNAMWVRAVSSAGYTDSKGNYEEVELEHWLTNLPGSVVRQIIEQQELEEEYLNLLSGTATGQEEAMVQETTIAYLKQAGLDVDAYTSFLQRQRRQKLNHIAQHGFDDGYWELLDAMQDDENRFLQRLGMNFDAYNAFAQTYEPTLSGWAGSAEAQPSEAAPGLPSDGDRSVADDPTRPSEPAEAGQKVYTREDLPPNIPDGLAQVILDMLNSRQ